MRLPTCNTTEPKHDNPLFVSFAIAPRPDNAKTTTVRARFFRLYGIGQ